LFCLPGTYSSPRDARLGNVPGYYRSSLTGLGYCGRKLVVFLDKVRNGEPTPGGNARVSPFFVVQGRRETEARRAFARRACTTLRAPLCCARFSTPPTGKTRASGPRDCGARNEHLFCLPGFSLRSVWAQSPALPLCLKRASAPRKRTGLLSFVPVGMRCCRVGLVVFPTR
jgi:hypothetical protein